MESVGGRLRSRFLRGTEGTVSATGAERGICGKRLGATKKTSGGPAGERYPGIGLRRVGRRPATLRKPALPAFRNASASAFAASFRPPMGTSARGAGSSGGSSLILLIFNSSSSRGCRKLGTTGFSCSGSATCVLPNRVGGRGRAPKRGDNNFRFRAAAVDNSNLTRDRSPELSTARVDGPISQPRLRRSRIGRRLRYQKNEERKGEGASPGRQGGSERRR